MTTKNLFILIILFISFASVNSDTFGQQLEKNKKTPEEIAAKITDRMKKNLSLSEDQYKQVYSLVLSKAQNRINNREYLKNLDKESRKQIKKQGREEFKKQLQEILNADQIQKMEENINKHRRSKEKK